MKAINDLVFLIDEQPDAIAELGKELDQVETKFRKKVPTECGLPLCSVNSPSETWRLKRRETVVNSLFRLVLWIVAILLLTSFRYEIFQILDNSFSPKLTNCTPCPPSLLSSNAMLGTPSFAALFLIFLDFLDFLVIEDDWDRVEQAVMKKFQLEHQNAQHLSGPHRLTDHVINADPLLGQTCSFQQRTLFVQILHTGNLHWVIASNVGCKKVLSLYPRFLFKPSIFDPRETSDTVRLCDIAMTEHRLFVQLRIYQRFKEVEQSEVISCETAPCELYE